MIDNKPEQDRVTFDTVDNLDIMFDWCLSEPVNIYTNDDVTHLWVKLKGKVKADFEIPAGMKPIDFITRTVNVVKEVLSV